MYIYIYICIFLSKTWKVYSRPKQFIERYLCTYKCVMWFLSVQFTPILSPLPFPANHLICPGTSPVSLRLRARMMACVCMRVPRWWRRGPAGSHLGWRQLMPSTQPRNTDFLVAIAPYFFIAASLFLFPTLSVPPLLLRPLRLHTMRCARMYRVRTRV